METVIQVWTSVFGPDTSFRGRSLETAPAESTVSRRPNQPQIPDRVPSPPPETAGGGNPPPPTVSTISPQRGSTSEDRRGRRWTSRRAGSRCSSKHLDQKSHAINGLRKRCS